MGYVLISRPASDEYWLAEGGRVEVDGAVILHDFGEQLEADDKLGGKPVSEWPEGVTKVSDEVAREFLRAREQEG